MTTAPLPYLLDPAELAERLPDASLRVVDLSPAQIFAEHHVPGAVHLPYDALVRTDPPVGGLVPAVDDLARRFGDLGIGADTHVVALDAEGGGGAGRLLWTLELLGHERVSLLDGGLRAWIEEGFPIERGPPATPAPATFEPTWNPARTASAEWLMEQLGRSDLRLLDARSAGEFNATRVRSRRGGHIPGAVHFEWTAGMDPGRSLRLRDRDELGAELAALGITPQREVVVYCHSHHRSAFSYAMLRALGHERVRGYPGSWSDWGNRDDTPIESG